MNIWNSAWKYVSEAGCRLHWERRNLLAASALRSAAWVAFWGVSITMAFNLLFYPFKQAFNFPELRFIASLHLVMTMIIYYRSADSVRKYLSEYACRFHWERRNLLAASALRSAARVAYWTTVLYIIFYGSKGKFFSSAWLWLWLPPSAFLAMTLAIYYRSSDEDGRKKPYRLWCAKPERN